MKKYTVNIMLMLLASVASLHAGSSHAHLDSKFVEKLIEPYFSIQEGLAADDLASAQTGAEAFLTALEYDSNVQESKQLKVLVDYSGRVKDAKNIAQARKDFKRLSSEMQLLVEQVGSGMGTNVYAAYCSMAFDNKGGAWLQKDETVNNPYYGSMMLRCGSIKKQLASGGGHDHEGHEHGDHSGHDHH